jgi:DNA helicase HerA-like ATPase
MMRILSRGPDMPEPLLVAKSGIELYLLPQYANRHGLIAGATGTGKTVTLQRVAEALSRIGVPVFMADVKGDLAGLSQPGEAKGKIKERIEQLKLKDLAFEACPVVFWDAFGSQGHPVRTTISEMGPLLLARMLGLNETQAGVLMLVFKIADDNRLLLLDLKDLRAMLAHVGENAKQFTTQYGNISTASIGAIQRGLLALESQGGDKFFGEPALNLADLMQTDGRGRGVVNILAADKLMSSPKLYSTMLLWLLSELFEELPEVGDPEKPRLVFFFDEAHLLFNDAPAALLEKIEQVVRLIRSKGVGVFLVTQNPLDIPDTVLGQLGNRVQHALRAFTPRDQKAVKSAATTLRANPKLDVEAAITELGVGEALVSLLDDKGRPTVVERAFVVPPGTRIGPVTPQERDTLIKSSAVAGIYDKTEDRESAYEKLAQHIAERTGAPAKEPAASGKPAPAESGSVFGTLGDLLGGSKGPRGGRREGALEAAAKSAARAVGSQLGREIVRGVLGGIFGGGKRRR